MITNMFKQKIIIPDRGQGASTATTLDNILVRRGEKVVYKFIDFHDGSDYVESECEQKHIREVQSREYKTTDHHFINLINENIYYVSLDNSQRSNIENVPLISRLPAICEVLNKILPTSCCVVFSEANRPSFYGLERRDIVSWNELAKIISERCGLTYRLLKANNPGEMSFGLAVFDRNFQAEYRGVQLHEVGLGLGCVEIKINQKKYYGIHFIPIDFVNEGEKNIAHVNMRALCDIFDHDTVCAFGDFNTIPGKISDSLMSAIGDKEFICNELSWWGSYFDLIKI
jgi:hypothetical protein